MAGPDPRFRDRDIVFANGAIGRNVLIETANVRNYWAAMNDLVAAPRVEIDGKLFMPPGARGDVPAVIVVPGSLSVAPSHLAHAERLNGHGIAALVLDPFGARNVSSTVANQLQYSFATSALDVVMALAALGRMEGIDRTRLGLQGHSRGGSAVLAAANARFAAAVSASAPRPVGVLAAYPWCGHQFLDPRVGTTEIRVLIGDQDDWCLPQQAQGHVQAIRAAGGTATLRLFPGAEHSFDRGPPVYRIEEASVSPSAPTAYLADDGAFVMPTSDTPDKALVDGDLVRYWGAAGYAQRGATIGGTAEQAEAFAAEVSSFWTRMLAA